MTHLDRRFTFSERLATVKNKRESLLLEKALSSLTRNGDKVQREFFREKTKTDHLLRRLSLSSGNLKDFTPDRDSSAVNELQRTRSSLDSACLSDAVSESEEGTARPATVTSSARNCTGFRRRSVDLTKTTAQEQTKPGTARRCFSVASCPTSCTGFRRRSVGLTETTRRKIKEFLDIDNFPERSKSGELIRSNIKEHETTESDLDKEKRIQEEGSRKPRTSINSEMLQLKSNEASDFAEDDSGTSTKIRSRISGICSCRRNSVSQSMLSRERVLSQVSKEHSGFTQINGASKLRARRFSSPVMATYRRGLVKREGGPAESKMNSHGVDELGNKSFKTQQLPFLPPKTNKTCGS